MSPHLFPLSLLALILGCASSTPAADEGRGGEIVGTWTITGDSVGEGTYTLQLERDGTTTLKAHSKRGGSESSSSASGPNWTYSNDKLTFNGNANVNGLKISGTWTLTQDGPDKITAKTEAGNTYQLTRSRERP